jgi:8-oxo-dGTP diphosphatase
VTVREPAPAPAEPAATTVPAPGVIQRVRVAAYAWIEDTGRVLLVRISAGGGTGAGRWTLPGGGLAFGEHPTEALRRELREETGLEIALGELVAVRSHVIEPDHHPKGHRVHAVGVLYRAAVIGGDLHGETAGSSDTAAWLPAEALDTLPTVDLVRWARAATDADRTRPARREGGGG